MPDKNIIISDADHKRLKALIEKVTVDLNTSDEYIQALNNELERARVVSPSDVPPEVITMNSVVRLRDMSTGETEEYELVYPPEADIACTRISILAPVGTALIGYQAGDIIEWPVPAGIRWFQVDKVLFQPERAGVSAQ